MSFYDSSDAIYGSGQYGSASYGRVAPNISLTGVSATGGTGEEQVYSIITPTQIANWVEKAA